jgi:hypothetical protein
MTAYAIICTGSWGDVLNTTPLAAQIKAENPSDIVHWYVASMYASALEGNPHIDKVFEINTPDKGQSLGPATDIARTMVRESGGYDTVFTPAPYMNRFWFSQQHHIVDCIRLACEETLPRIQWKTPWIPTLNLTPYEVDKTRIWKSALIPAGKKTAIFEYDAKSGQCQMQASWIPAICELFGPEWVVVLSGKTPVEVPFHLQTRVIRPPDLTIRASAELFNQADFMIGVSSGISAACSSTWTLERAKTMPWIEICNNMLWSGSFYKHAPRQVYTGGNLGTLLAMVRPLVR